MDVNSWDYVLFSRRKEKRVVATEIQLVPRRRYLKQQRAECNLGKTNTMAHQSKHKTWQMINKDFPSFSFLLRFLHCWNSEKFIGRYKTNQFDKFLWKHFVSAVSRIRRKETFFSVRRSDSEWAAARRCRGGLNIWQERGWDLFLLWQDVGQRAVNTGINSTAILLYWGGDGRQRSRSGPAGGSTASHININITLSRNTFSSMITASDRVAALLSHTIQPLPKYSEIECQNLYIVSPSRARVAWLHTRYTTETLLSLTNQQRVKTNCYGWPPHSATITCSFELGDRFVARWYFFRTKLYHFVGHH